MQKREKKNFGVIECLGGAAGFGVTHLVGHALSVGHHIGKLGYDEYNVFKARKFELDEITSIYKGDMDGTFNNLAKAEYELFKIKKVLSNIEQDIPFIVVGSLVAGVAVAMGINMYRNNNAPSGHVSTDKKSYSGRIETDEKKPFKELKG